MSFHEEIEARSRTAVAIFHKFRTGTKTWDLLNVFVEGYDDVSFYDHALTILTKQDAPTWSFHISYGKGNLDRILDLLLASDYKDKKVVFIRDSDFDLFLSKTSTTDRRFLTCGYSVENYVCTEKAVERFIRAMFGIDPLEVDPAHLAKLHSRNVRALFDWLSPLIGAAMFAVKCGSKLDLDQINVGKLYRALLKGQALPTEIPENLWKTCGILCEHFNDESRQLGLDFARQEAMLWLRGKYILECTSTFLSVQNEILRDAEKSGKITQFNKKSSPDLSPHAVFERLCGFAALTDNFKVFFQRWLEAEFKSSLPPPR